MPPDVKREARAVADHLMEQPAFKESLNRYMRSVEQITQLHTRNPEAISEAKEKAYNDLRDRVANVIVRGAAQINKDNQKQEYKQQRDYYGQRASASVANSVAKGVWKGVWNAIEGVRMQSEAQSEMQKRQMQKQHKRQLQQNHEKER